MSKPYDQSRDPRTGRPPQQGTREERDTATAAASARREEREALESAVKALEGEAAPGGKARSGGERPEALSQFAESARHGEESPKEQTADRETAPRPTSNREKHEVAERLLHKGAEGDTPDPHEEGADRLPDRIIDRG